VAQCLILLLLETVTLGDHETKKESIRLVLSFFKESQSAHADEEFDFLGGGGTSVATVIRGKAIEFLKRSNVYNNQELDPEFILEVLFFFFYFSLVLYGQTERNHFWGVRNLELGGQQAQDLPCDK